ncbi:MAG: glutamine--fructose-6-phosphate transaminase (isomerizing) [Clostridia bacterium]|nr:glutamine--fructose-6-phosphate transaminase (isomerizing) [Clostridia bacterium]
MCGIFGYVGTEEAAPILLEGLKRLEYRGYDSAGIALVGSDGFRVAKQKGRLAALEARLADRPIQGHVGIGHTRWATHGEPSDVNSHPHLGERSRIAVVHNGIIENYAQLRERLEQKGVTFLSQTDSEVVAQLAEYYYDGDLLGTIVRLTNALEGSYALGILCLDEPDTLVAVRKDNPLVVGVAKEGSLIASDIPALLRHTNQIYTLDDKEIAVLKQDGVQFFNSDLEPVSKIPETVHWSADSAEKGGYPHFMIKEIMEQPKVLRDTLHSALGEGRNRAVLDGLDLFGINKVVIAACGSAYNAGMVGKYVFERLCRVSVEVELASEFRYKDPIVDTHTLVVVVSQSGETADSIAALREAKSRGADTLAIVNVLGSTIAKEAAHTLYTAAGPEIAVATTKAFSAQLILLYLLAIRCGEKLGRLSPAQAEDLLAELETLPGKAEELLAQMDAVQKYAATCVGYQSIFFIGRNIDYAIALEGSLKLKEISYIHSEAYAGGELKHGTISLVEENTLVVVLSSCAGLRDKIWSNAEQVMSRGAKVLLIGSCAGTREDERCYSIPTPGGSELFSPSLSVLILQLLSYYVAANKGLDIDKPRNLAKSVTVE